MKYVHVLITELDCDLVKGYVTVLNECREIEKHEPIEYSILAKEDEIAILADNSIINYKLYTDHIGGGGIKRPS